MTTEDRRHRRRTLWSLALASIVLSRGVHGQEDLRELGKTWNNYSPEAKAAFLAGGLLRSDAKSKALALAGVTRLAAETPDVARSRFNPEDVRSYFSDSDKDVVKAALSAYRSLQQDDAVAEAVIVEQAQKGGGPLRDWEYIRYLEPDGISSGVAEKWLLKMAEGPISTSKFEAVEALAIGMERPPPSLLPEVLALIRSNEYFCHFNLVRSLPKFGPAAAVYVDELAGLRRLLVEQIALPEEKRVVRISVFPPDELLGQLDKNISTLRRP